MCAIDINVLGACLCKKFTVCCGKHTNVYHPVPAAAPALLFHASCLSDVVRYLAHTRWTCLRAAAAATIRRRLARTVSALAVAGAEAAWRPCLQRRQRLKTGEGAARGLKRRVSQPGTVNNADGNHVSKSQQPQRQFEPVTKLTARAACWQQAFRRCRVTSRLAAQAVLDRPHSRICGLQQLRTK